MAAPDSVVELVPAISLALDGADIPPAPQLRPGDDPARWERERAAWRRSRRIAFGLDPDQALDGLTALDECTTPRLLEP